MVKFSRLVVGEITACGHSIKRKPYYQVKRRPSLARTLCSTVCISLGGVAMRWRASANPRQSKFLPQAWTGSIQRSPELKQDYELTWQPPLLPRVNKRLPSTTRRMRRGSHRRSDPSASGVVSNRSLPVSCGRDG